MRKARVLIASTIILFGIMALAYPVISTLWNNYEAKIVSQNYAGHVSTESAQVRKRYLEAARRYNAARKDFRFVDPYQGENNTQATPDYQRYVNTLNDPAGTIGIIKVPKIGVSLPIYHGTSHETLQRAAGHLYGSDLPVGGAKRHSVITAHTGLANATMFDKLTSVRKGDYFCIEVQGETLKYRDAHINVVRPEQISLLQRRPGEDLATLVTCTPYGVNSHRLLVTGSRVFPDPKEVPPLAWQLPGWMILFLTAIAVSIVNGMRLLKLNRQNNEVTTGVKNKKSV